MIRWNDLAKNNCDFWLGNPTVIYFSNNSKKGFLLFRILIYITGKLSDIRAAKCIWFEGEFMGRTISSSPVFNIIWKIFSEYIPVYSASANAEIISVVSFVLFVPENPPIFQWIFWFDQDFSCKNWGFDPQILRDVLFLGDRKNRGFGVHRCLRKLLLFYLKKCEKISNIHQISLTWLMMPIIWFWDESTLL